MRIRVERGPRAQIDLRIHPYLKKVGRERYQETIVEN